LPLVGRRITRLPALDLRLICHIARELGTPIAALGIRAGVANLTARYLQNTLGN
jgi:hypothetical protein